MTASNESATSPVELPPLAGIHEAVCEVCSVCGRTSVMRKVHRAPREGYRCAPCGATLRYRDQAAAILLLLSEGEPSLAGLAASDRFSELRIFEPGLVGPFRPYFAGLPHYQTSYYWPELELGEEKDGIPKQDLQALTFDDEAFDLVITSDIFEHIFNPWRAFEEVQRVLTPGGHHVCSIPLNRASGSTTVTRAREGADGVEHLLDPVYHGSPKDPEGSLVCTDFGLDVTDALRSYGIAANLVQGHLANVTLVCTK